MSQLSLDLRNFGIEQAITHADMVQPLWSEMAFDMLCEYIHTVERFMAEDFRVWASAHGLSTPPSLRAYGGVINRAKNTKLIRSIGIEKVTNPTAHCAFASVWTRNL